VKGDFHMSAKEELFAKREKIVQRILNLSDEQLDRLLTLHSQQEQESYQTCPAPHRTSA
jgi:hypothetical protein